MKFKVLRGKHSEKNAENIPILYKQGDIVDSKSDLSKLNAPGMQPKFEKVEDSGVKAKGGTAMPTLNPSAPMPATSTSPSTTPQVSNAAPANIHEYHAHLDKMTVKELQDHAAEEEVDVKSAGNDKNKLLAILKKV